MASRIVRSAVLVTVSLFIGGALTGCDDKSPASAPATPATSTPTIDEFAARDQSPDPAAVGIGLTDITLTHTDSADRVTFQFTGSAVPGWAVHYVNQPVQNGTQAPFPITGPSIIEVLIREAPNPFGSGAPPYTGPDTLTDPDDVSVGTVRFASQVRGVTQAFIGLQTPQRKFRVTGLTGPVRVVVEIDHK